jgi:monoamine oxidase
MGAACVAGGLSATLPAWARPIASGPARPAIAIVGGGLAGLNAAWQLKKQGIDAQVYEGSRRWGGRVLSRTGIVGDDLVCEIGGEFINSDHADMLSLVQDFGLSVFNRADDAARFGYPRTAFFFEGKTWHEDELADLLRPLADQIAADAALLDQDWDRYAARFDHLSVARYLDRHADRVSAPVVRRLIDNTVRTEYGVEPEDSSALQLLFMLPTVDGSAVDILSYSDEVYTVDGGNSRIVDGLTRMLAGQLQAGRRLEAIEPHGDDGYRLRFQAGAPVSADYVILALPFTLLRKVHLDVSLPPLLRHFINDVDLGANDKLLAGFARRAWRQPAGFVGEAWTDFGCSEMWDGSQRQTERTDGALTYFLGGREVDAIAGRPATDAMVGREFTRRLDAMVSGAAAAATDRYASTDWTRNPWTRGAYTSFRPGQYTRFGDFLWVESDDPAQQQQVRVGKLLFAGEHVSDEYYGFMNGAAQTGRLAAQAVLQDLV